MSGTCPPRKLKKLPESVKTGMAVLKEGGETSTDIAEIFGVDPRTVRRNLALISEDEKRSIRQFLAAQLMSDHFQLAKKARDALLARDFNRVNPKTGRYETSEVQLATLLGISTDKIPSLSPSAGMADPQEGGGGGNPLTEFLLTGEKIERAAAGLPKGTRVMVKRSAEISLESQDSSDVPPSVSADWSED